MKATLTSLVMLYALAGCEGPPPVPNAPTWVDDVEPILRGNCFHCHGSAANPTITQLRWDFYFNPTDPKLTTLGIGTDDGFAPFPAESLKFPLYTRNMAAASIMPPPPALPLSDRDYQVLKKYASPTAPRGMRANNAKPTAAWVVPGSSYVVSDADLEQVVGTIQCGGGQMVKVLSTGRHDVPQGSQRPCTLSLYDGQDLVTVTLN
jgi:hypothetical protein